MGVSRFGEGEVMIADCLALLESRPDPICAAVVGDASGRADPSTSVDDEVLGLGYRLREYLAFSLQDFRGIFKFL